MKNNENQNISSESEAKQTLTNIIWRLLERFGAQIITLIVSIVIARILDPSVYGTVAIVTVIITILNVFVDSGLGTALVQKKDSDNEDFSTVFYFNLVFCLLIYLLLFFLAPLISYIYQDPVITSVVRVLGLTIIISGVKNVQQAYVAKTMQFKKFFFSTLIGTIISAVVGILMAIKGFGVWALVCQHLSNLLIDTIVLWFIVKWRPKLYFSLRRLKTLFSFGWKILVSSLIGEIYDNLRQLLIGGFYSSSDLAFFNRGKQFPNLIVSNINSSLDSVILPVLSKRQEDINMVKQLARNFLKISSFVIWPIMFGLAAVGHNFILLILTDKRLPCLPYLYIFCFVCARQPMQTANLNSIKSIGRADIVLKLEIIKKVVGVAIILSTLAFGPFWIAVGSVFYTLFATFVNAFPNKKLLGYSYVDQIKDILPSILVSLSMFLVVFFLPLNSLNLYLRLAIQVTSGIVLYFGVFAIFRLEPFPTVCNFFRRKKHNK